MAPPPTCGATSATFTVAGRAETFSVTEYCTDPLAGCLSACVFEFLSQEITQKVNIPYQRF